MISPRLTLPCAALALCISSHASAAGQTGGGADAGVVVARDAQTGQLRPATPAELRALAGADKAMRPAPAAGPVKLREDGRREVHLGEAALVHATLRRDADGRTTMECVHGDAAAANAEAGHAH
jgi:hypothetical protein